MKAQAEKHSSFRKLPVVLSSFSRKQAPTLACQRLHCRADWSVCPLPASWGTHPPGCAGGSTLCRTLKMAVLADFALWILEILQQLFLAFAFIGGIFVYTVQQVYSAVAYAAGLVHFVLTEFVLPLVLTLHSVWLRFWEMELLLRRLISTGTYLVVGLGYYMATVAVYSVWWVVSCVMPPVLLGAFRTAVAFVIVPAQVCAEATIILFDLFELVISTSTVFYSIIFSLYSLLTGAVIDLASLRFIERCTLSGVHWWSVLTLVITTAAILFAVWLLLYIRFHFRAALRLSCQALCNALLQCWHSVVAVMQYLQQYVVGTFRWQHNTGNFHPGPRDGAARNGNDTSDLLCIICVERVKCVVLQPCNHLCLCQECERRLPYRTCPICRRRVAGTMRVYV